MPSDGLEPPTFPLGGTLSAILSYKGIFNVADYPRACKYKFMEAQPRLELGVFAYEANVLASYTTALRERLSMNSEIH